MFKMLTFRTDGAFWPLADQAGQETTGARGLIARIAAAVLERLAQRRGMRELAALDDRMLKDIGIAREQIPFVVRNGRDASGVTLRW